ncbi:MFS transporter [Fangia hongkongensis]|uniref:MFS transporter n=1 Tax=Fangia hongkongensis TaxID=270495 RepID=UPI0003698752|nr:MFS transporter [Fangia hongkongensis]MBK2125263.1 MFS transporter [Fangia hongkongensis]
MKKSLFSLLLVVFIDAAGIGILFPILNSIIMDPTVNFLPHGLSSYYRHLYYGAVIAVFFLCWFVGATFISKASDDLGRKKALLICLYGIFVGYALTILAIYLKSMSLLILGRVIGGLTAASQPVAQAAIIDISSEKDRTKNLGLIMFAFSLGLVAGPLLGGMLSDNRININFTPATPFYVILIITIVNLYCLIRYFKNKDERASSFQFKPLELITQFLPVFRLKQVRNLSLIFFIMQFAFNTFYVFIPAFLYQKYGFKTLENSMVMLALGLSMAISSGFLVPRVHKHLNNKQMVKVGLFVMLVMVVLLLAINSAIAPYILAIPYMLAFGIAYTSMLALFSQSVDEAKQGWVMGITVSLFTLGAALTSFIGGWLMMIDINLPMIVASVGFLISLILMSVLRVNIKNPSA